LRGAQVFDAYLCRKERQEKVVKEETGTENKRSRG